MFEIDAGVRSALHKKLVAIQEESDFKIMAGICFRNSICPKCSQTDIKRKDWFFSPDIKYICNSCGYSLKLDY